MPRGSYLLSAEEENDGHFDVLCFNPNDCDLTGAPADITIYAVPAEMELLGAYIQVLVQVDADTIAPIVTVDAADYDNTTNRTELVTHTFTDSDPAGLEVYIPLTIPLVLQAGQTLILEHQVAGTDAAAAAGTCYMQAYVRWTGRG